MKKNIILFALFFVIAVVSLILSFAGANVILIRAFIFMNIAIGIIFNIDSFRLYFNKMPICLKIICCASTLFFLVISADFICTFFTPAGFLGGYSMYVYPIYIFIVLIMYLTIFLASYLVKKKKTEVLN